LIFLYDDNHISIEGSTDLTFTENRRARFSAYGWHVARVEDGNDLEAIALAIAEARAETHRPSLIAVHTHIGFGSPNKEDTAAAHGEPLGQKETLLTKERLDWPPQIPFHVPEEALNHFRTSIEKGRREEVAWKALTDSYRKAFPDLTKQWRRWMEGGLPEGWEDAVPFFPPDSKGTPTRVASGTVLNAVAGHFPNLIGGSADLAPSNKTLIKGEVDFQSESYGGHNLRFGVREHGMGSVANGMALHGGLVPYVGTFLVFADYMRPAIRLAALMSVKVIYVFTHDSIGLGEDGPTHQPVEHLASLRAIPNLTVIRPCDANETAEAWRFALRHKGGPVLLALTRQGLPVLAREKLAETTGLHRGGYTILDSGKEKPDLILLGSGSEVHFALDAARALQVNGVKVRVVSLPSWEIFESQPQSYKDSVLPPDVKLRIGVEAGVAQGWERYLGDRGAFVGMERFGASAPHKKLYQEFGLTAERVVEKALGILGRD
jgi:transketolase